MTAAIELKSLEFRREREEAWRRLEALVERVERRGLGTLTGEDRRRLPMLYRGVLSSLSVARSISLDRNLYEYLESLAQRAYLCIYGTRRSVSGVLIAFFRHRFPEVVRRHRWHVAVAAAFLLLGVAVGWALVSVDLGRYYAIVPDALAQGRSPASTTSSLREGLYDGGEARGGELGFFASTLFAHNSRVGMLAFAVGFLAGIPTCLLLFGNGLVLGAFAALYADRGLGVALWGWLLPHGITEILAVVLCGAAGLVLADRLVFPGRHERRVSLARGGREAGVIVIGAIAMLFLAGLLEGFFRQLVTRDDVRYLVAAASAALWWLYFVGVPRWRARP